MDPYVFISYSSKEQSAANSIRGILLDEGIKTWMAPWDIPVGNKYAEVINRAIKNCSCFILVLSEHAQNSIWVAKEVERAVNYRRPIIPVVIEEVILNDEFELYISTDQSIILQKINKESDDVKKMLAGVRSMIRKDDSIQSDNTKNDETYDAEHLTSIVVDTYSACKIYMANDAGYICFASDRIKSHHDNSTLMFEGTIKESFTESLGRLLAAIYQIDEDMVSIDYELSQPTVKLVPFYGHDWNAWSVEEAYRIHFKVYHFESEKDLLYGSFHLDLGTDLELSFFTKDGHYIHKPGEDIISFNNLGLDEALVVGLGTDLIRLSYPNRFVKVQKKFIPKFYSDCSGGYHLKFLI